MSEKPIFLVSGATGVQGGNVVKSLLKTNKWRVKATTRDPNSHNGKWLKENGVEVVKCDITNPDQLKEALKGVDTFFGVTNWTDPSQKGKEFETGKIMVDCAKEAGIKHFIFSTLPNAEKISGGKWDVPNFTDKAKIAEYALQQQLPTSFVMLSFYYQNFFDFNKPQKDDQGNSIYKALQMKLPACDATEVGDAVVTIANNPKEWLGKTLHINGDNLQWQEYVKTIGEVKGEKVKVQHVTVDDFPQEFSQMFEFFKEYNGGLGKGYVSENLKLYPKAKTFKQFLTGPK